MTHMQIEFTNRCDLQCVECPHRLMKRKQENMSDIVFGKVLEIIKQIQPQTIIPHKDGEPLLHPQFFSMIDSIAYECDAKIDIYTNGFLLKKELILAMDSLSNKIVYLVSFHFHKYDGSEYDYGKVNEELRKILELDLENSEFIFVSHVTDLEREDDLIRWQNGWTEFRKDHPNLGAVHVNKALNPWTGLIRQKNCITFDGCPYLDGEHFFIGVTGNILPCCMDLEEELVIANVNEDLDTIMQKRENFYKRLGEGILSPLCEKCLGAS